GARAAIGAHRTTVALQDGTAVRRDRPRGRAARGGENDREQEGDGRGAHAGASYPSSPATVKALRPVAVEIGRSGSLALLASTTSADTGVGAGLRVRLRLHSCFSFSVLRDSEPRDDPSSCDRRASAGPEPFRADRGVGPSEERNPCVPPTQPRK